MAKTTQYMIAAGASVVVVRDGKRIPIAANGGYDFTEEEIASINKAVPGSLRKPINEGTSAATAAEGEDDGAKKPAKKAKKAAKPDKADGADSGDEDEDI